MKPKIKKLTQTCGACPSQWEASTDDGRMIYIRYRWGGLSVSISKEITDDIYDAIDGDNLFCETLGDSFDGLMSEEAMKEITKEVIDWN